MKIMISHTWIWLMAMLGFCIPVPAKAYSVLTHEALIDATWDKYLQPLLKQKYGPVTEDQLKEAHAYAYGGAIAPDMGYYPFGSKFFTNLVHYVRSGDFVTALLSEAQDMNEYAFALGALCHYNADDYGHALGVNLSVPLVYTKDKKYGTVVTYAEDPVAHVRMEFGFDVLQTARGNYASTAYHNYIGFKVATHDLERAFLKTYGIDIHSVFGNLNRAVETFRWTVKSFFPEITKAAWATKKQDIKKLNPGATSRRFIYRMHRANYFREFGKDSKRPGVFANLLAGLIRVLPKIGPLKVLKFKAPGPIAEKLFIQSFDTVLVHYSAYVHQLNKQPVSLPNIDFDTGKKTVAGEYELTDKTYAKLLLKLREANFNAVDEALQKNLLAFYHHASVATGKPAENDPKITEALSILKNTSVAQ